jgi:hypothetical protein
MKRGNKHVASHARVSVLEPGATDILLFPFSRRAVYIHRQSTHVLLIDHQFNVVHSSRERDGAKYSIQSGTNADHLDWAGASIDWSLQKLEAATADVSARGLSEESIFDHQNHLQERGSKPIHTLVYCLWFTLSMCENIWAFPIYAPIVPGITLWTGECM